MKARLAAGQISIDECRQLLTEISEETTNKSNVTHTNLCEELHTGQLIAEFEDLRLFEHVIIYKNTAHLISDIKSVGGQQTQSSVNFVPTSRMSRFGVQFLSGEVIQFYEYRTFFGGKRHDTIGRLLLPAYPKPLWYALSVCY